MQDDVHFELSIEDVDDVCRRDRERMMMLEVLGTGWRLLGEMRSLCGRVIEGRKRRSVYFEVW